MKNVVILAMSTFPNKLTENRFTYDGSLVEGGIPYYSQLEPISKMILLREGSLDHAFILATAATSETKTFILDGEEKVLSPVDFYKERLSLSDDAVDVIPIDEDEIGPAIRNAVAAIRKYWDSNEDEKKLWMDTQGGFRDTNLVMNAIISLLRSDNTGSTDTSDFPPSIVPQGRYSISFNRDNSIQRIKDQTSTYRVFDFVSGIKELTTYGRAEQLCDYYNAISTPQRPAPEIIDCMKKLAEAIQLCDIKGFEEERKSLSRKWLKWEKKQHDPLFSIFEDALRYDYEKLLNKDCSVPDVIEWMWSKKFYQQALTYIESRVPQYWEETKILFFRHLDGPTINEIKSSYQDEASVQVNGFLRYFYDYKSKRNKNARDELTVLFRDYVPKNCSVYSTEILQEALRRMHSDYQKCPLTTKFRVEGKKNGQYCSVEWKTYAGKIQPLLPTLFLYKLLKNERNKLNHMGGETRATEAQLHDVITYFVEENRRLLVKCESRTTSAGKA